MAAVQDAEQAFLKVSLTRLPGRAAAGIVADQLGDGELTAGAGLLAQQNRR
ncbi:hypothetical protein [Actinoplanes sp. L3-i22]|uniref:hypothetical protein n=1 Tax=Actinoplanes sp. L3-i22 TaxID=2836373 RepID=UPI001C8641CB|nr:hypothetical protein [Actinoplanes sp. L3-i22]